MCVSVGMALQSARQYIFCSHKQPLIFAPIWKYALYSQGVCVIMLPTHAVSLSVQRRAAERRISGVSHETTLETNRAH